MDKNKIKVFFDNISKTWDADMIRSDEIINTILENARVGKGTEVLDVACGTGILIPDYLKLEVKSVLGVDISDKMLEIAKSKFQQPNVKFICQDAELYDFNQKVDAIVIYNAFPHFPNPEQLIAHLSSFVKEGGTLTVAHGMSREEIDAHHRGPAKDVSMGLMTVENLAKIFEKYLKVTVTISNDRMYQVVGCKTTL